MPKTSQVLAIVALLGSIAYTAPRNIILMIGDGSGAKHLQAIQYYLTGKDSSALSQFPVQMWMSTYSAQGSYSPDLATSDALYVKRKPTDSAASATALSTGKKTYDAAIGVGMDSIPLITMVEAASEDEKSTGVVTTVPISHATPAAMVAHNTSRNQYSQIAQEMFLRSNLDVIIGGGNPNYDHDGATINNPSDRNYQYVGGQPTWLALEAGKAANLSGTPWTLVQSKGGLDSIAHKTRAIPASLAGIMPVQETMQQKRTGAKKISTSPTLATMSLAALTVLNQNPKGFFVMIEGGAIDWASHSNQSERMIEEGADFLHAVDSVLTWINKHGGLEQNLLIVTADHETGFLSDPVNQGKGAMPKLEWKSTDHTNQLVKLYAIGNGSKTLPDRTGKYTDNARLGQYLHSLVWHERRTANKP
jgi:alkaline phosphatase